MSFELIILGSSSALPTSKRYTAAHLLNINERFFLIDCGEGTQIQLRKNKLSPARINNIFISHIHGDHIFGLFGLLSSMGMMGRKTTLNLLGPSKLEEVVSSHLDYFGPLPYELNFVKCSDGKMIFEDSKTEVVSFSLKHRTETFGYLFREKERPLNVDKMQIEKYKLGIADIKKVKEGKDHVCSDGTVVPNDRLTLPPYHQRSYAYISDTAFHPRILKYIEGVDIMYHEATFLHKDKELAKLTMHSTARQAAEMADKAKAGKLLIGHFSTRYKKEDEFIEEANSIFPETIAVNDNDRFLLEMKRETRRD